MYGHHPHIELYLCAKFELRAFLVLRAIACRKIVLSVTQSYPAH